jgi:hypothetical protein
VVLLVAALTGAAPTLSAELLDGVHTIYLPVAVLLSARLLSPR